MRAGIACFLGALSACASSSEVVAGGGDAPPFVVVEPADSARLGDAAADGPGPLPPAVDAAGAAPDGGGLGGGEPGDCDEGYAFDPARAACVDVDACADDNGGCGDPDFVRCVDPVPGQEPRCEDIDECADPDACDGYPCIDRFAGPPECIRDTCPAGSIDWYGDASLCVERARSFHVLGDAGCALLEEGRLVCPRGDSPFDAERRFRQVAGRDGVVCGRDTDGEVACTGMDATWPLEELAAMSDLGVGADFVCGMKGGSYGSVTCVGDVPDGLPVPGYNYRGYTGIDVRGDRGCALLREDASVRCFGADPSGALEALAQDPAPDFVQLSLGAEHGCALRDGGVVHCWSERPPEAEDFEDARVRGPNALTSGDVVEVSAGAAHTCVRFESGRAQCWGEAAGDEVEGPGAWEGDAFVRVEAMDYATCAFTERGPWQCWGRLRAYGLANGLPPMQPRALAHTDAPGCFVREGERLDCDGGYSPGGVVEPWPMDLWANATPERWLQASRRGTWRGQLCMVQRDDDQSLKCIEQYRDYGSFAYRVVEDPYPELQTSYLNHSMREVFAVPNGVCGFTDYGRLWCFGEHILSHHRSAHGAANGLRDASPGGGHTCIVKADGGLTCWGDDPTAAWLLGPNGSDHAYTQVEVTDESTCALREGGRVDCWGAAAQRQLAGLDRQGFARIALGSAHACGLRRDGSMGCAGSPGAHVTGPNASALPVDDFWLLGDTTCILTAGGAERCWGGSEYDGTALVVARQ